MEAGRGRPRGYIELISAAALPEGEDQLFFRRLMDFIHPGVGEKPLQFLLDTAQERAVQCHRDIRPFNNRFRSGYPGIRTGSDRNIRRLVFKSRDLGLWKGLTQPAGHPSVIQASV